MCLGGQKHPGSEGMSISGDERQVAPAQHFSRVGVELDVCGRAGASWK